MVRSLILLFVLLLAHACHRRPPGEGDRETTPDSGQPTWVKSYEVAGADFLARAVAGTTDGGSYQLGQVIGSDAATAAVSLALVRLDAEGNVSWARRYGRYDVTGKMKSIVGAAEATDGHVWVAGRSLDDRAIVFKLDASGQRVSYQTYDGPGARVDLAAIAADRNGGFVLAGTAERTTSDGRPLVGGDLWLVHADDTGAVTWRIDDDPTEEPSSETVVDVEVDSNGGVTVLGRQYSRADGGRFWVAHFHESGARAFADRLSEGQAAASVMLPHVGDTHVDANSLVAVGVAHANVGTPQMTFDPYLAQFGLAYDDPGDVAFSGAQEVGSSKRNPFHDYVGVALGAQDNHVLVAANRHLPCAAPDPRCSVAEGVLRVLDADDDFAGADLIAATALGLRAETTFTRLGRRASDGDYWLLVEEPEHATPTLLRLGAQALDVKASFAVAGADLAHVRSGGVLTWTADAVHRVGDDGAEVWRMEVASPDPLSADPIAVAPLTDDDGGALVAAKNGDGLYLLRYSASGDLRAARRYTTLALDDLAPVDLDGDGKAGDAVLASLGGGEVLRLRSNGEVLDRVSLVSAPIQPNIQRARGPFSAGAGRLVLPTPTGYWWFDAAGASATLWGSTDLWGTEARVTPDGGLWQLEPGLAGTPRIHRFDRDGRHLFSRTVTLQDDEQGSRPWLRVRHSAVRADGGLYMAGSVVLSPQSGDTCGVPDNCADGLVVSIDPNGNVAWTEVFGAARQESFGVGTSEKEAATFGAWVDERIGTVSLEGGVVASLDGGVLLTGVSNSYAFPRSSVFSVRVDANGHVVDACAARRPHTLRGGSAETYAPRGFVVEVPVTTPVAAPPQVELALASDPIDVVAARSCGGTSTAPVLVVNVAGQGAVTSNPAGIECAPSNVCPDCPRDCEQAFRTDSAIILTATPAAGYRFARWGGDCATAGTAATALVALAASKTCSAQFSLGETADDSCNVEADCADFCAGECTSPRYTYCESGSHQCYCGCDEATDCVPDDPRPACGGSVIEACGQGTGVTCVTLEIAWTINGNLADATTCPAGWSVALEVSRTAQDAGCLYGQHFIGVPPGPHEVRAVLSDASGTVLDTQVVAVYAAAPWGTTQRVDVAFDLTGAIDVAWTVNGGANCLPGSWVDVTATATTPDGSVSLAMPTACEVGHAVVHASRGTVTIQAALRDAAFAWFGSVQSTDVLTVTKGSTQAYAIDIPCPTCPNFPP